MTFAETKVEEQFEYMYQLFFFCFRTLKYNKISFWHKMKAIISVC